MARTCRFERGGIVTEGAWRLHEDILTVTPAGAPAQALHLRELQGIGGNELEIELATDGGPVRLSHLGGEAGNLLAALQRSWLPLRTDALRLTGTGERRAYRGAVARSGQAATAASFLLFDDVLLCASHGHDLEPVFLAHLASVVLDAASYRIVLTGWDGSEVVLSKLAGQTSELADALGASRAALARAAATVLASALPILGQDARTALATRWLPGLLVPATLLDELTPGALAALRASWIAALPRRAQLDTIEGWADRGQLWLGYARPETGDEIGSSTDTAEPELAQATAQLELSAHLWLLARHGERWLLENLSADDHATYRFLGGDDLPALCSSLLAAQQFSREALYLPLAELIGARLPLAAAARDLGFLVALRERFAGRVIHTSLDSWRKAVEK
jgi:hypothetical protein